MKHIPFMNLTQYKQSSTLIRTNARVQKENQRKHNFLKEIVMSKIQKVSHSVQIQHLTFHIQWNVREYFSIFLFDSDSVPHGNIYKHVSKILQICAYSVTDARFSLL